MRPMSGLVPAVALVAIATLAGSGAAFASAPDASPASTPERTPVTADPGAQQPRSSGLRVSVAPTRVTSASGALTVRLRGLPSHVGVYVRFCQAPRAGTRPGAAQCYSTTGAWGGVWAVARYPYGARPTDGSVVNPAKSFRLRYVTRFNGIDCSTQRCGVYVRRDHRGGTDTSYDRFIRVRVQR
jgi:hypothetical protein